MIADGIGQLRMAELYQQLSRDQPPPEPVDLDAFLADALAATGDQQHRGGGDPAREAIGTLLGAGRDTAGHLLRRQAGIGRRLLGEVLLWPADPTRSVARVGDVAAAVQSTAGLLTRDRGRSDRPSGSPLWRTRSRHRHLEHVQVPLEGLKAAAKALGGSVNDGFMVGLTEAAVRYHQRRDTEVDTFNTSFVVSTRSDDSMGGNSFTPVPVQLSGRPAGFDARMAELRAAVDEARHTAERSGGISGLSAAINLLPTSVVTQTARRQAAAIDFATSNLRGAPFPLYCAGAKVEATICMGPLAGTAVNATALSHDGRFDIGLFIDPRAVEDPADYRRCVEESFADLLALAPADPSTNGAGAAATGRAASNGSAGTGARTTRPRSRKTATGKTATRKTGARKTATRKTATRKTATRKSGAGRAATRAREAGNGAAETGAGR